LNFDVKAANAAAIMSAQQRLIGHSKEIRDTLIAGIAIAQNADLATRNVRHFQNFGIRVVNPWSS
jgi:predicted nucleic acid-binding protein